jgi:hypothetical protein
MLNNEIKKKKSIRKKIKATELTYSPGHKFRITLQKVN